MPRITDEQSSSGLPPIAPDSVKEITRDKISQLRALHSTVRKFAMHVPEENFSDMEAIETLHRTVPTLLDAIEAALNECEWLRQQLKEAWSACADAEASLNAEISAREEEAV